MDRTERNRILDAMTDEAVWAAMEAVRRITGIAPTTEDGEALSDWLQDRFLVRVEDGSSCD